jgi:protoporphyrinogen oxidase
MSKTIVLGGGAAGLSAAWDLSQPDQRAHRQVMVVDANDQPGGLCRTFEHDGYRFDLGGHRVISRDQDLLDVIKDLLQDDLLHATRQSCILLNDRRYRYPLEPIDLARNLDPMLGLRGFFDYLKQKVKNRGRQVDESTFKAWTLSRYGETFYELFFGPYTEKLWGIPADTLAGDWAAQRISLLSLTDVLVRLLNLKRHTARTYARRYLYPRGGIGQLFAKMADALATRGTDIRMATRVVGFGSQNGRVKEVHLQDSERSYSVEVDEVISTLPLPDLAKMLMPRDISLAQSRLDFRGVRFMNIMLDKENVSENTWMYVPDPRCCFTRIQEPKRRSPESAPPGKTSLMLEIPCDVDDATWRQDDEDLLDRCLSELSILGYPLAKSVHGCFSTRITHGYPVFRVGYQDYRQEALDAVGKFTNVITCGRQGTFRYVFMDTAMQMGQMAAKHFCEGGQSIQDINSLHNENKLLEAMASTA